MGPRRIRSAHGRLLPHVSSDTGRHLSSSSSSSSSSSVHECDAHIAGSCNGGTRTTTQSRVRRCPCHSSPQHPCQRREVIQWKKKKIKKESMKKKRRRKKERNKQKKERKKKPARPPPPPPGGLRRRDCACASRHVPAVPPAICQSDGAGSVWPGVLLPLHPSAALRASDMPGDACTSRPEPVGAPVSQWQRAGREGGLKKKRLYCSKGWSYSIAFSTKQRSS